MPSTSGVKVGLAELADDNADVLPVGLVVSDHPKVSASPLASELELPSKLTDLPAVTVCAKPALATGATLAGGCEGPEELPPPPQAVRTIESAKTKMTFIGITFRFAVKHRYFAGLSAD